MLLNGKCPGCAKTCSIAFKAGEVSQKFSTNKLQVVTYVCALCDTILGVETDPLALISDVTERVAQRLGAGPKR